MGRRMLLDASRRGGIAGYWHSTDLNLHCAHSGLVSSHLIFRALHEKQPFLDFLCERRVRFGVSVLACFLWSRKCSSGDVLLSNQSCPDHEAPVVNSSSGVSIDMFVVSVVREAQRGQKHDDVDHGGMGVLILSLDGLVYLSSTRAALCPAAWEASRWNLFSSHLLAGS